MKKLLPLLSCLLVIGCGEKKGSADNTGAAPDAEAAEGPDEEAKRPSGGPEPLIRDADVERFAKDAMDSNRGCPPDDFTGWSKLVDQGQLVELVQWKNGRTDGPAMLWYETGQIF